MDTKNRKDIFDECGVDPAVRLGAVSQLRGRRPGVLRDHRGHPPGAAELQAGPSGPLPLRLGGGMSHDHAQRTWHG